jgi:hypothetical protein
VSSPRAARSHPGSLDLDLRADRNLLQRSFEGAVPDPRGQAEDALLVWRRHYADVPSQSLVVLVTDVGKRDEEVLPGFEVDLFSQ